MSFTELDEHPDKFKLMGIAKTIRWGTNKGENDRELNPVYRDAVAQATKRYSEAVKRAG